MLLGYTHLILKIRENNMATQENADQRLLFKKSEQNSLIQQLRKVYVSLLGLTTSLGLLFMLWLAFWQVYTRYIVGKPAIYTEELLRFVMIWVTFLGAALAFESGKHLALTLIPEKLSKGPRKILYTIINGVILFFILYVLLWGGLMASQRQMLQITPIMGWPMGRVYWILPLSAILSVISLCFSTMDIWATQKGGES